MDRQERNEFFQQFESELRRRNNREGPATRLLGGQDRPLRQQGVSDPRQQEHRRHRQREWRYWVLPLLAVVSLVVAFSALLVLIDNLSPDLRVTGDTSNIYTELDRDNFFLLPDLNVTGLMCQYASLQQYIKTSKRHGHSSPVNKLYLDSLSNELDGLQILENRIYASLEPVVRQRNEAAAILDKYEWASPGQGGPSWQLLQYVGQLQTLSRSLEMMRSEARKNHAWVPYDLKAALRSFDHAAADFCRPIRQTYSYELYGQHPTLGEEQRRVVELAQGLCVIADVGLGGWRQCTTGGSTLAQLSCPGGLPQHDVTERIKDLLDDLRSKASTAHSLAACGTLCSLLATIQWILGRG